MMKLSAILFLLVLIAGFILNHTLEFTGKGHQRMNHTSHMKTKADEERVDDVARRGGDVMPFNLHDTTHHFVKSTEGGIQQVVAKMSDDVDQVQLVRTHLKEIHEQFQRGDFSGPAHIHGNDMPGLVELQKAGPGEIDITYKDIESGAELTYLTSNAALVTAIHIWFDAQVSDHGEDATNHQAVSVEEERQ